ncbi:DUF2489 domain-containing protein [Thalassotalea ponticola]|uniref:DUF2489 domain-containing protein n=1 Tax=Thalassotalea ponticola TaxID=1523392 RepID=UPI0025B5BD66|nr:DUF2489 domain-containing protein [Thalassotalea ponticola]MDN3652931.1 DUF2489 domain-containing protein [Thalassotalea ponticola]
MTVSTIALLVVGGIIIFALAVYASFLLFKLRHQKKKNEALLAEKRQKLAQRDIKALQSISHICRAMSAKQCEVSEGSWRLSVLMDSLPDHKVKMKANFPAIFTLYSNISHMPILDERKKLSKKERLKLDLERMGYEEQYEDAVFAEVDKLLPYSQTLIETLQSTTRQ